MLKFVAYNQTIQYLESFDVNKRLLGYDFFIIIPSKATLPFLSLSRDFSDSTMSNGELIALALQDAINKDQIFLEFNSGPHREDIGWMIDEGLKYLNGEETQAIVGYEFVF